MSRWAEQQAEYFRRLNGCFVTGWVGQEMAIREQGLSGKPEFHDLEIPYLQVNPLYAVTMDGVHRISTYQNDVTWGLCVLEDCGDPPSESHEPGSIFLTRSMFELPPGRIEGVSLSFGDEGDIEEVIFSIGGKRITL